MFIIIHIYIQIRTKFQTVRFQDIFDFNQAFHTEMAEFQQFLPVVFDYLSHILETMHFQYVMGFDSQVQVIKVFG